MLVKFTLFLSALVAITRAADDPVTLGAIFDEDEDDEPAFKFAVDNLNAYKTSDLQFASMTKNASPTNSFAALNSACSLLEGKVIAIFGPQNLDNIHAVHSVCDHKDIPHVIAQWDYSALQYRSIINLHPRLEDMSQAYVEIIMGLNWKTFTIFYEDVDSLRRMTGLIQKGKQNGIVVTLKKLDASGIYRNELRDVASSGQKNFVIDCQLDILGDVLMHAQQVGLLTQQYSYFITNLDMHLIDLEPFQYSGANITGMRLINPESHSVSETTSALSRSTNDEDFSLMYKTALIMDGVNMIARALEDMPEFSSDILQDVGCESNGNFQFGSSIVNLVKASEYFGLTGLTKFNNEGQRSHVGLDIVEVAETGLFKRGTWNSTEGLHLDPKRHGTLRGLSLIVITCLTKPYGMLKETADALQGNDRFEGFAIDLIQELAAMEGFNYTFIIRHDKANGKKDKSGNWSGMIGDLIAHNADLAITDLTITAEREEAVDFTPPFMNLGISILFRKPKKAPPSFFSFADPFALETWGMLALAYVVVSISLFVIGRICPAEWTNPYPCIEEPEFLVNQYSLLNSAWFTIGSLMQQGTEIAPIGIATRMVAGMWWFFVLIMVSSYTANLAAFLATENPIHLFTDIASLVANAAEAKIRYGAKLGGATAGFFSGSENEIYQKVADHMKNHPEDMVKENDDGVKLAEEEAYAVFMESTSIDYETQRHCNLQQYGGLLDDKGYGIAMRKNSPYRKILSTAVLKLQAAGTLASLKRKWWEEQRGGGQCAGEVESQNAEPLRLQSVEGVFYVTIGGLICSVFCVIIEMVLHTFKTSVVTKTSFKEALKAEVKAYLDFNSNVKAVVQAKSQSKSNSKSESKSKSKSETPKDAISICEHLKPEPYGFIASVSKDRLTESS